MLRMLVTMTMVSCALTGCGGRDLAYYRENPDEAKAKAKECDAAIRAAFMEADEARVKAVIDDPECIAASEVRNERRSAMVREEYARRVEENERRRLDEAARMSEATEAEQRRLLALDYVEFNREGQVCGHSVPLGSPRCKAYSALKPVRLHAEVERLIAEHPGDALTALRAERCAGVKFDESHCETARLAESKQDEQRVRYLLDNRDELKRVFNRCQADIHRLWLRQKREAASTQMQTFECRTASAAARELKIYDFSKPIG